jgi:hypothetical protein
VKRFIYKWIPRIYENADFMALDLITTFRGSVAAQYTKTYYVGMIVYCIAGIAPYFIMAAYKW